MTAFHQADMEAVGEQADEDTGDGLGDEQPAGGANEPPEADLESLTPDQEAALFGDFDMPDTFGAGGGGPTGADPGEDELGLGPHSYFDPSTIIDDPVPVDPAAQGSAASSSSSRRGAERDR